MKVGVKDGHLRWWPNEMICENQPAKERQTRGEVPADKWWRLVSRRRRRVKRMRGGGGVSRGREAAAMRQQGVTRQPAGEQEVNGRGGVCRQEAVDHQEDKKQQRCNKRHRDNQLEAPVDKRLRHL
jgi:hypothetical protein